MIFKIAPWRLAQRALLLLLGVMATARASDVSDYLDAKRRFDELVVQAAPQQRMPRMQDAEFRQAFNILTDRKSFLDQKTFTRADLDSLMSISNAGQEIGMAYMTFGLDDASRNAMSRNALTKEIVQKANHNVVEFQDETTLLLIFGAICFNKVLPLLSESVSIKSAELNATQRSGIRDIRNSTARMFDGLVSAAAAPTISISNRRKLLAAASEVVLAFASSMDMPLRQQIRAHLASLAPRVPSELSTQFDNVKTALDSNACNAICLAR